MKKRIFICYSHKDEKWKGHLATQLNVLDFGDLDVWDDRRIKAGADWFQEITEAINRADAAILLISANFLTSDFIKKEEIPRLLQKKAEENMQIFPLIVRDCAWTEIPWLKKLQVRPKDGKALSSFSKPEQDTILSNFAREIKRLLLPEKAAKKTVVTPGKPVKGQKIDLAKLPTTGETFLGREKELKMLDEAWKDPHTHIVTLVAWGGVGKTALVNEWLAGMEKEDFRGAERVYGWSFYSQGAGEDRQTSADDFIDRALRWFGDPEPEKGSPWDKGKRLAALVRQYKTLLILDGLEPLQYPPGEMQGCLKDKALQALLKELCRSQPGLCVISTRIKPADMAHAVNKTVQQVELSHLSPKTGAALLQKLGIKGTTAQLQEAAEDFKGHALALNLLGRYLSVVHEGDIRKRDLVPKITEEEKEGGHARRVMESYEKFLSGKAELDILRLLGLFDRPAEERAIDALRAKPPIPGLTEALTDLPKPKWKYALKHLRDLGLLAKEEGHRPDALDTHPLVREHFGAKLRDNNPAAFTEAHTRLYEYYKNLPEKEYPDTLQEMEPLYTAVSHGCLAGLHQEAFFEIFWVRIRRGEEAYSVRKINAFGSHLAALSCFFENPWSEPFSNLLNQVRAFILNEAGFCLRAMGRLKEAAQPMHVAVKGADSQEDWANAGRYTSNLSELLLTSGEIERAVGAGEKSIEYSDRSGSVLEKYSTYPYLAASLHQAGEIERATELFRQAEDMQKEYSPEYPYLYSRRGYLFCDLLLDLGRYGEVLKRMERALNDGDEYGDPLLDIALYKLALGRTYLQQAVVEKTGDFKKARDFIDQSVNGLLEAGTQHRLPSGLLARAALFRTTGEFAKAREDLEEALEIAEQGGMRLHLADYYLESTRLYAAQGEKTEARDHLDIAKKMIAEMGYHRRDREIEELESILTAES